ncbi:MAG: cytochrome c family protein [Rubripirellula sp.]
MFSKTCSGLAAICIASVCSNGFAATSSTVSPSDGGHASIADPQSVLGNETCVKCHASEIQVWKQTPHSKTFEELHRRPEAKKIAAKLGLNSIKSEGRCVACHYTQKAEAGANPHVIAGVSCESCHGAAKNWLDLHHDYGGEGITRLTETPEHRVARISKSVAAGMRNPSNVYSVAQSCLRCHTTADEELVNVGGHTPGSLEFEFVSWSQGMVRHNFVRTDGKANEASSPERVRVMFVAGMVAELEASMRATAKATQKATYGVTAAKRAARAGARIKSVAQKVDSPTLDKIVRVFESVTLKLNNADQLSTAADQVATLGYEFASSTDGSTLGALDSFVPKSDRFK